ncbi:tescalcin a [Denticeps clupeoides]|uniref:Calcineurin B homologous protein 3 n=1 Tax=Denticeps clupeoides TaxID=299321 RepID=A0AAY4BSM0_9TELE|nr:calcineurin B homologous protein 3 [Denticeps clupeoides]
MGAWASGPAEHEFRELPEKTGFSVDELRSLYKRFMQLCNEEGTLRQEDFEKIEHLQLNPIRSKIIRAFFDKRNFHKTEVGTVQEIGFVEFVTVVSYFKLPETNQTKEQAAELRRKKLRFLFNMHDTDSDETITLEEYKYVIEDLLSSYKTIEKETAKAIADSAMLEVANITGRSMENCGSITFEEFFQILQDVEVESKMNLRF